MISVKKNLHIVRVSALYDLIVTAGFMTPWTASWIFKAFAALSDALGLNRAVPTLDVTAMLFANLLGSLVVVWSLWRLVQPARTLFVVWQLFAVAHGASFLILGFTCFEVGFAMAQLLPLNSSRKVQTNAGRTPSGLASDYREGVPVLRLPCAQLQSSIASQESRALAAISVQRDDPPMRVGVVAGLPHQAT
jgi:hypothetical protein